MKVKVHVLTPDDFFHEAVSIDVKLPVVPVPGDFIWLSNKDERKLNEKAEAYRSSYLEYVFPKGSDRPIDVADCIIVKQRWFDVEDKSVHITIGKE